MGDRAHCDECEAIAEELGEAYADAWFSADQVSKDAWIAVRTLIGGTEQDAVRAEEVILRARFQNPLRINQALQRKFAHEARSGHKILRAGWEPSA
jgi:hypothetical protein